MIAAVRSDEIRSAYLDFLTARGHVVVPPASLVPHEDPTTLFNGSGMQPLIPYLLGADHPSGNRIVDAQPCFRAEDVDEVGDNRHTTFFEMLGNWALGSYFKAEQLPWFYEFVTAVLGIDPHRLYVTAFGGAPEYGIPRDDESAELWRGLFASSGIDATIVDIGTMEAGAARGLEGGRIFFYGAEKNWWTRSGLPESMPPGEPGGPDAEMFYEFTDVEHDPAFGANCHVHCDCGRFIELGNSVFMEYVRTADGFDILPRRNVDFGGGLERFAMAVSDVSDVFRLDLLWPIIQSIESQSGVSYEDQQKSMRVIADHLRAAVFLAADGVVPSNTTQGYVMRRFVRRALRQGLFLGIEDGMLSPLVGVVAEIYRAHYPEIHDNLGRIEAVLSREEATFRSTLARGTREFPKIAKTCLTGDAVFTLFDTFGFPPELSIEEAKRLDIEVAADWQERFDARMAEQRERSRSASAGTFKGGLADHSVQTTKLHTATHLLYKSLRLVLGDHVVQRGSNITPERLRFDFSHPQKMTPEEIARVEELVRTAIERDLPMSYEEMAPDDAFANGALGAFGDRYGEVVRVYTAGDPRGDWFSREICGGPHVERTSVLGRFRIVKEESSSAGIRRIRAVVEEPTAAVGG
jgi:alanyl-tRNA synthetase